MKRAAYRGSSCFISVTPHFLRFWLWLYFGLLRNYVRPPAFERLQPHWSGPRLVVAEAQEIVAVM